MLSNFFNVIGRIAELSEDEKATILSLLEIEKVDKSDFLLREGEICKYEFFILEGLARTYYIKDDGTEHTSMFAFSGWWTGDLISFQKKIPSKNYIQTLDATT